MNKEVLLTVLGVIGTLGGTLLGWLLNAYTYKIAKNSRQIAVLLENFYFEVQKSKGAKIVRISALNEKDSCCCVGNVQVSARTAMAPQIIEPRKLQFFTVRIDTTDPEIQYAKLTLCAYDEDGKLHKFLVYNSLKVKRPPAHTPKD